MINKKTFGLLIVAVYLTVSLAFASTADAATRAQIKQVVVEESLRTQVPPELALAVAKIESDFQAKALSKAGARGVMQIMPKTARGEFGVSANQLWKPRLNVRLGLEYLERLYHQYGRRWDLALSHYNGGTLKGRGARAVPHSYTRKYVADVLRWRDRYQEQALVWRVAKLDNAKLNIESDDYPLASSAREYRPSKPVKVRAYRPPKHYIPSPSYRSRVAVRVGRGGLQSRLRRARRILDDFSEYLDERS